MSRAETEIEKLPTLLAIVRVASPVFRSPLHAKVPLLTLLKERVPVVSLSWALLTMMMTESF